MRVERLEHIGLCVTDLDLARRRFDRLFGLASQELRDDRENGGRREARILLPNRCSLRLVEDHDPESRTRDYVDRRGEGMDHIALLTSDIDHDVRELRNRGVALSGQGDCGSSAGRGRAVWVDSDRLPGMAVELIAPRPRGSGAPLGDPRSGH